MDERKQDLCRYRIEQANETLIVTKECYQNNTIRTLLIVLIMHFNSAICREHRRNR